MSTCPPVSACLLTAIQTQIANSLVDSAQIRRQTATAADGAGGLKASSGDGWTTLATVACLLTVSRLSARERIIADQITAPVYYDVYVAHGTDVKSTDQLVINSRTFEVEGVSSAGAWAPLDKIYAVELQP